MASIQLAAHIEQRIAQCVADGHVASAEALVEEAVTRLFEDIDEEHAELEEVIAASMADIAAGNVISLETSEDIDRFMTEIMAEVRAEIAAGR